MNIKDLKSIQITDLLERLGHKPDKIRDKEYWYKSPFRKEDTASFKVNIIINTWFDMAEWKGGNIVDLAIRLFNEPDLSKLLNKIENQFFSLRQQMSFQKSEVQESKKETPNESKIEIIKIGQLQNQALLDYLASRHIDDTIAAQYCREIHYKVESKQYHAIGFKNNSGGFELRNKYFKGAFRPKDFTFIDKQRTELAVVEGFFDFLTLRTNWSLLTKSTNYLILNSLALFEKAMPLMKQHEKVYLLLDHDEPGTSATSMAIKMSRKFEDMSDLYQGHKDLNEWHVKREEQFLQRSSRGMRM
ncbi:MAG: hypothetical protein BGN92_02815 [Sphingobacteriales bacterium 41-5]|nr:MAG: hypothetical protein BGN92_02815 [Sphingobacteriales bacterium 41-5]